jgi:hypothetical protein
MRDSPDSNNIAVTMAAAIGMAAVALVRLLFLWFILLFGFINISEMIWNLTIYA